MNHIFNHVQGHIGGALRPGLFPTAGQSGGEAAFDPVSLFASGEAGAIYDFTDRDTLYQDTSRTVPVTQEGQLVYGVADISGNDNHASRDRGAPRFLGWPAAWGAQMLSSPSFETPADWTAGTGWAISGGTATKTAGTAASLSQAVALEPGKIYLVFVNITSLTAGSLKPILSLDAAGTGATISNPYDAAWSTIDLLVAGTGQNTLEIYADATFAGTVNHVGIFEVTALYDAGVSADFGERIVSGTIDMSTSQEMTVIASLTPGLRTANKIPMQVAATASGAGSRLDLASSVGFFLSDGTSGDNAGIGEDDFSAGAGVWTHLIDYSQAAVADQNVIRINGLEVASTHDGGPLNTATMLPAAAKISLLSYLSNNSFYEGLIHRVIVINRKLSGAELISAENWCAFGGKLALLGRTGDSTWEDDGPTKVVGRTKTQYTAAYAGFTGSNLTVENWGDDTADQNTKWSALTGDLVRTSRKAIVVGVGLNDIGGQVDAGATVAARLALLQSYINEIKTDCPSAKIIGWKLHPVLEWLEGRTNAADCIAALATWNAALTDGTITGLNYVVDGHLDRLGTIGSYLDAYLNAGTFGSDLADGVHPNALGRLIMGVELREGLVALGISAAKKIIVDLTPPSLSLATDVANGSDAGTLGITTDDGTGTLYWVVTSSASAPSATQVQAGQDHTGSVAADSGSQAVATAGAISGIAATGLAEETSYYAHFCHVDENSNASTVASGNGFTTAASGDVTAPTLSAAADTTISDVDALLAVTTDEGNGVLYWVATTSATAPSAAQVQAGQDHTGAAAVNGAKTVSATGEQKFLITGLTASTAYYAHFCHVDASANASSVVSGNGFTTGASEVNLYQNYEDGVDSTLGSPWVLTNSQPDPYNGSNAILLTIDSGGGTTASYFSGGPTTAYGARVFKVRYNIKLGPQLEASAEGAFVRIRLSNMTAATGAGYLNLRTGSVPATPVGSYNSITATDVGDGWWHVYEEIDLTGDADTTGLVGNYLTEVDNNQFVTRDGTWDVYLNNVRASY